MRTPTWIRPLPAAFGLAFGLASAQTAPALSVEPNPAPANQTFMLELMGTTYDCYTFFDRESVTVSGSRIDLRYTPEIFTQQDGSPETRCPIPLAGAAGSPPSPIIAELPRFNMPALKAGRYEVWATAVPACRYGRPACAIAEMPRSAGTLTVGDGTARTDWYLKERTVAADRPFTMQLLRDDIGSCQTEFTYDTARVVSGSIYAAFLMVTHPDHVCVWDPRPYGPSFSMPGLEPGLYPVLPQELLACQVAQPACYPPVKAPVPTDTLVVTRVMAISLKAMRAAAPRAEVRGGLAYFALPEGPEGAWRAELSTLDGRVLGTATVRGAGGSVVSISADRAPRHALSLIRLVSPAGRETLLPLDPR
jgi:hypothetical protein